MVVFGDLDAILTLSLELSLFSPYFNSIQFNFIYIAPNHNISRLKALHICLGSHGDRIIWESQKIFIVKGHTEVRVCLERSCHDPDTRTGWWSGYDCHHTARGFLVHVTLSCVAGWTHYEDNQAGDEDAFAREPFILRFDCPTTGLCYLVLIPVHTKPEDTLKELDELHDVVEDIRKKWKNDNIMILGDFNADGRYLSKKKKEKIRICSPSYDWLIDDDVDTTASNNNDNTYDRIVVYGETMSNAIVPNSAKSFNFQQEFKLTDEEALSISDHYPVEVELKTRAGRQKRMCSLFLSFVFRHTHLLFVITRVLCQ
uniref:Deoxyribonuclease gamma-like n=1 Tax=Pundamilia nyererei TaxID=303518 RepID=A0A3B4F201_9CICH